MDYLESEEFQALKANSETIRRAGTTTSEILNTYSHWVQDAGYDKYLQARCYTGPAVLVAAVANYIPDRRDVRILDIAAGTGLVGKELVGLGFNNIDAVDPSVPMLEFARSKNLYTNYICDFFPGQADGIQTNTYDVLVSCGSFIEGHVKCDAIPEAIRCVKPGGLVVFVMRENDVLTIAELKDRLEPLMRELEEEGQWTRLERRVFKGYQTNVNGILFVFKITK